MNTLMVWDFELKIESGGGNQKHDVRNFLLDSMGPRPCVDLCNTSPNFISFNWATLKKMQN